VCAAIAEDDPGQLCVKLLENAEYRRAGQSSTTANTPFAPCDYNPANAKLGWGPDIDPPVLPRGMGATLVGPFGAAPGAVQDDLPILTRFRVSRGDPTVDRVETTRSNESVRALRRSDSHAKATTRRGG
jgi:hypothetical protein